MADAKTTSHPDAEARAKQLSEMLKRTEEKQKTNEVANSAQRAVHAGHGEA